MNTYPSPGMRAFWRANIDDRPAAFAAMRREDPVAFQEEGNAGRGFWSVTSHADVMSVSRDTATYSSTGGFSLEDAPPSVTRLVGSMLAMDDPEHARLRRLVQAAFTLRAIRGLQDRLQQETDALVSALPEGAEFVFVERVAAPYPLQVICDLLAVPEGDRDLVRKLVDEVVGASDPDFQSEGGAAAGLRQLYDYAIALGRERKAHRVTTSRRG